MSLRRFFPPILWGLAFLVIPPGSGFAQLTVQQPVVGVNSVATTVSVPDRGRIHLGSISRARASRSTFGPFRSGTNIGFDREHSEMSVGVTIHDFEAMDRYLLNQGKSQSVPASSQLSGNARHAWNQLQAHHGGSPTRIVPDSATASKSEKYWLLGQKAEREGNLTVAKLHYRIASRYGSLAAKTRLGSWDSAPSKSSVASAR